MLIVATLLSLAVPGRAEPTVFARTASLASVSPPIVIRGARFLSEMTGDDGRTITTETTTIPYRVASSCYRWVLEVEPRQSDRTLSEVLVLPTAPAEWGIEPGDRTIVDPSRRLASTEISVAMSDTVISNAWCVAPGDPQGRYSVAVFDGRLLLHEFDFTVGGTR